MAPLLVNESEGSPNSEPLAVGPEQEQLAQIRSALLAPQDAVIAALQQQVASLQTRIQDVDLKASDTSEVLAVQQQVASLQTRIQDVDLKASDTSEVLAVQQQVVSLQTRIQDIDLKASDTSEVLAVQQQVASLQTKIQDVDLKASDTSEVLAVQQQVASLQTRIQDVDLKASDTSEVLAVQQQMASLQTRIQDMDSRVSDTSEVLAVSVKRAHQQNDELGAALKPIVIAKFHETSREDPDTMAEALFPILGPAVRKMIVNIITPDKNAKKFGYQVEQLFVIENATGLPVCHVASESAQTQDADMVSGMLSAIQSFVQDAFKTKEFDGLNTLQMGDLSVWIEWGPQAVLAAVVRGAPPQRLRDAMQIKIEKIHEEYNDVLKDYDGDASKLDSLVPELKTFLNTHDGSFVNTVKNFTPRTKRNLAIVGLAMFGLIIWMLLGRAEQASWDEFITTLGAEPGLVVTDQRVENGVYKIFGLKDEFASIPADVHKASENEREVEFHFEPYQSLHPEFIQQRAVALLKPPADVEISIAGSTMYISGKASLEWIEKAKPLSQAMAGASTTIFNVRTIELNQ